MHYSERAITRSVFRAYDIRGLIGVELDEDAYYTIGRALAVRLIALHRDAIFVARDGRLTSESLSNALIQGLVNSGIQVIHIGMVPTSVMYYATCTGGLDCGVMVTGSHNPADYNGIKMVLAGKTLVQSDIETLYDIVAEQSFQNGTAQVLSRDFYSASLEGGG